MKSEALLLAFSIALCSTQTSAAVLSPLPVEGCTDQNPCQELTAAPLDPLSPWPKFRGNLRQTGRSLVQPQTDTAVQPWSYYTSKGVFSSPVITRDGAILIGSADRRFYRLSADGRVDWSLLTGEIIDSAALIDRDGQAFFGSGDGYLRAIDGTTGHELWSFAAESPRRTGGLINWFEGNVAVGLDGRLYAPNDNFRLYSIDRATGQLEWSFRLNDQSWSLPAVDPDTGVLYFGSNYIAPFPIMGRFFGNIFALRPDGSLLWRQSVRASVTASPLLSQTGLVVVGAFDGSLRAYRKEDGRLVWSATTGDHLYASPAELSDGTIIQPSTDSRIYAFDGATGERRWAFDAGDPVRSSPAVDSRDVIYFGGGDGALYALNPDGSLRFRMQLISGDRNDLNASPALGRNAIVIAGEDGSIWSVPYDYCLREGLVDTRCSQQAPRRPGLDLTVVTDFGSYRAEGDRITPLGILTLYLSQTFDDPRDEAALDPADLHVLSSSPASFRVQLAGDQRTLYLIPDAPWGTPGATVQFSVQVGYRTDLLRRGLKRSAGVAGKRLEKELVLVVSEPRAPSPAYPLYELTRLAVPLPSIMPSYNQIGFDSLSHLVRIVHDADQRGLALMLEAERGADGVLRPRAQAGVPLFIKRSGNSLLLENHRGFSTTAMNITIPFEELRMESDGGRLLRLFGRTACGRIPTYGYFLRELGFCSPQDDLFNVSGVADWRGTPLPATDTQDIVAANVRPRWLQSPELVIELDGQASQAVLEPLNLIVADAESLQLVEHRISSQREDGSGRLRIVASLTAGALPGDLLVYVLRGMRVIGKWQIASTGG